MRAVNGAIDEKKKKVQDDKKVRQWVKEREKLDQGKRQQGSDDEGEEEEEGLGPPSNWMTLVEQMRTHPCKWALPVACHGVGERGRSTAGRGRRTLGADGNRLSCSDQTSRAEGGPEVATHR